MTWNAKPENRLLPSWWENLNIRLLTDKKKWTEPQREMMGKAGRVHGIRSALVVAAMVAIVFGGITIRNGIEKRQQQLIAEKQKEQNDAEATRLVEGLLQADTSQVKTVIGNLTDYRQYAKDDLSNAFADSPGDSNAKLHAALAMLPEDDSVLPFLKERLLAVSPIQFGSVRNLLEDHKSQLVPAYWEIVKASGQASTRRFQATCALATFDPANEHWQDKQYIEFITGHLVGVLPSNLLPWRNALRPVKDHLTAPLEAIYRDGSQDAQVRGFAADTLADYLSDNADGLFDLLADANVKQFAPMFGKLAAHQNRAVALGNAEVSKKLLPVMTDNAKEALAKRQANVAVALLRMNQPERVWPLLRHSPDPRVRSYLIDRLGPLGADAAAIVQRLNGESDITIRRALILSLGEFSEDALPSDVKAALVSQLQEMHRTHADPGLHAASEWLLRQWKQEAWLKQAKVEWAKDKEGRDKRLDDIAQMLEKEKEKTPQWYVNSQGQTLVVIPGPSEFLMGSPLTETGRNGDEVPHTRRISRTFALATTSVTLAQYRQFEPGYSYGGAGFLRLPELPVVGIDWYRGAKYCNWLSKEEGIREEQWCYEITGNEIKLKANYLSLGGYRLPTEAEVEYATRAGSVTSRYFGETDELLAKYGWYIRNSQRMTWPVGSLKPNDLGLFDVHGSVWIWCQEGYKAYPQGAEVSEDHEDGLVVTATASRVLRGGSFNGDAQAARSAIRGISAPGNRSAVIGFRVARTYP